MVSYMAWSELHGLSELHLSELHGLSERHAWSESLLVCLLHGL